MQFDMPKDQSSIIKVIGVGGGGCNAVTHMYHQGIQGVNFAICNTDAQAMELSPVTNKIQLGPSQTEGRGAGNNPGIGREATEESLDTIKELLQSNTKMVFVTAGMGGGTGTGGAPVIAKLAKEMGILTVGIISEPFYFEGPKRRKQAEEGVKELRQYTDTMLLISNDKLREIYGNLKFSQAFANADDVLATAAKGIAEIITVPGYVNVDFEDVKAVMVDSGVAIMGSASAEGDDRATQAVSGALASPLLADNEIKGAKHVLLNITSGTEEILMDEIMEITEYVREAAGADAEMIWGSCVDESVENKLVVTVIATGFEEKRHKEEDEKKAGKKKVVFDLEDQKKPPQFTHNQAEPESQQDDGMRLKQKNGQHEEQENQELANQITFPFESKQDNGNDNEQDEGMKLYTKDEQNASANNEHKMQTDPWKVERDEKSYEANGPNEQPGEEDHDSRLNRLRGLSMKMNKDKRNIEEMEREPAFKRKNVDLKNEESSDDENMSRYTLDEETKLRRNNPYLHDRAD